MKNRNKDSQILDILDKMLVHDKEVVVNTAKYIIEKNVPIHVMGEDLTYDNPHVYTSEITGQRLITTMESVETFEACTEGFRIYLSKERFYQNPDFKTGKEAHREATDDDPSIERTEELGLINCLVHETNHIINKKNVIGQDNPTPESRANFYRGLTSEQLAITTAMDEYHAYTAAQGNLYGMSDKDIRSTIENLYTKNRQLPDGVYQVIWNVDNSF